MFFNLSKISIKYQRPINNKNNRISFILNQETQYYNKNFTEFDLQINGVKVLFNKKYSVFLKLDFLAKNSLFIFRKNRKKP